MPCRSVRTRPYTHNAKKRQWRNYESLSLLEPINAPRRDGPKTVKNRPKAVFQMAKMSAISAEQVPSSSDGLRASRSEEHTSELQSRENLVCRLLLEK